MKEERGGGGVLGKKGLENNLNISRPNGDREELSKIEIGFPGLFMTASSANLHC